MSVVLEFCSLIIPIEVIHGYYPGGLKKYKSDKRHIFTPENFNVWFDDNLVREGSMGSDFDEMIQAWEKLGVKTNKADKTWEHPCVVAFTELDFCKRLVFHDGPLSVSLNEYDEKIHLRSGTMDINAFEQEFGESKGSGRFPRDINFTFSDDGKTLRAEMVTTFEKKNFRRFDAWTLACITEAKQKTGIDVSKLVFSIAKPESAGTLFDPHVEALRRRLSFLSIRNCKIITCETIYALVYNSSFQTERAFLS